MPGASRRTASDRAPPPISNTRAGARPCPTMRSAASASEASSASTAARATFSLLALRVVIPRSAPVAPGRSGVRSPSRYGSRVIPPAPGSAATASADSPSRSVPSIEAVALSTRPALIVHTSGRNRPVASANPATAPDGSAAGTSVTANAVPEVPIDTATSPGCRPSPSAAPMLSPVPADTAAPQPVCPTTSAGRATLGTATGWPSAASARSGRQASVAGEK